MELYGGIDLHNNNSVVVVSDEKDKVVYRRRHPNDLEEILGCLEPYGSDLVGVVVESTSNWYWLVDGLQDAGYRVHLANTTAIQQYSGLKYADDSTDARWLAHLLRLGVLPTGYIYPREQRALRDLLRKRISLVQLRTSSKLNLQNLSQRNLGRRFSSPELRALTTEGIADRLDDPNLVLAMDSMLQVTECLDQEIQRLEREILRQTTASSIRAAEERQWGRQSPGPDHPAGNRRDRPVSIGRQLRLVLPLRRQPTIDDHKLKGRGNTKNGNRYLAWVYVEAANFAIRYYPEIKAYYQRKAARTHRIVALKTVAHKLARASYYVMRNLEPFELKRAFG